MTALWSRLSAWLATLKTRLALAGALLIAASVVLATWVALRHVDEQVRGALLDREAAFAESMARVIGGRLVTRQLALRRVAATLDAATLAEPTRLQAWLQQRNALLVLFSSIFVAAPNGKLLVYGDSLEVRIPEVDIGDRPYFKQTLQDHVPHVSEPVMGRVSGSRMIILTLPVYADGGRLIAVVCGAVQLTGRDLVADVVDNRGDADSGRVTAIFDSQGRFIAHPDASMLLQPAESDARVMPAVHAWRGSGSAAEPSGLAQRDGGYIFGIAGVPLADWNVVSSAPEQALIGGVEQARRQALWWAVALALLGGAALWVATLQLLRPFEQLKRRATSMSLLDSAADALPWPAGAGEVGEMARLLQEVEARSRADAAGRAQLLRQMNSVLANASVGILFTADRKLVLVSQALCRMLGYTEADLTGRRARMLWPSDAAFAEMGAKVEASFALREQFDGEVQLVQRDGGLLWVRLMGRPVEHDNPAAGTIWIIDDISDTRLRREQLAWASSHDSLTGLLNRPAFEAALGQQLLDRRSGLAQRRFCVMAFDLDRFKEVNDAGGHAAGDAVLRDVSALTAKRLRRADIVARIGGDEFAALLNNGGEATAVEIGESICAQVADYRVDWGQAVYGVGVSIGVVEVDIDADAETPLPSGLQIMSAADTACYAAKRAGRSRVCAAPPIGLTARGPR